MEKKKVSKKNWIPVASFVGFLFIMTSIVGYYFSNYIIHFRLSENLKIENNSKAFEFLLNPPAAIYRKYYFFDVQNSVEVLNGQKPILIEKGPYTYRVEWHRKIENFLDKDKLNYSQSTKIYFEPSLSKGNQSDVITFLNIPAIGMINKKNMETIAVFLMEHFDTELFIKRTIKELISGYDDPLMELKKKNNGKFSIVKDNGTEWQSFVIDTGFIDPLNIGKVFSWNGLKKLNYWNSEKANQISGTDGTFYPPYLNRSSIIESYSPEMCRSYGLEYLRDNEINGVKTYDFHFPSDLFSASKLEQEGFCDGKCLGNGVLNISSCYGGVSGFISQPHFLNADEKFVKSIKGLEPNKDIHDFLIHFEPTTGVPVAGNVRFQINFYLEPNKDIDLVKNIQPVLLPVIWFDEEIKLDSQTTEELSKVAFYVRLVTIIPVSMVSTGILLILVSSFFLLRNSRNKLNKNVKKKIYLAEEAKLFTNDQIDF